jgi:hypothetical protein
MLLLRCEIGKYIVSKSSVSKTELFAQPEPQRSACVLPVNPVGGNLDLRKGRSRVLWSPEAKTAVWFM